ncbi:protein translocase subunit SecY [Lentisphaera araneosa HTCC2155]|uniref:Protein translocase subunit SecY n=1 Tax=Lentisphaera araneosa HTCC2155 TaxID=313628 RepID=A6DRC9_9BACT|nr:preprotein translocase subunit SecY [Lentisphaera araneosa]EDM25876.1 protein translocase subunit SecY [Lentisphaera araneosa HTCC2155]
MLSAFQNMLKVQDLRKKLLYTVWVIVLVRVLKNVPIPGIDLNVLADLMDYVKNQSESANKLVGMANVFSGGALQKLAIGVLGIMPYITASIIMQLMTPVFPNLEKLQKDGSHGRQKLNQYTRYMTIVICAVQSAMMAVAMHTPSKLLGVPGFEDLVINKGSAFVIQTTIIVTASAILIMWLGEQITDKGLGNGASIIITINVLSSMPQAFAAVYSKYQEGEWNLVQILVVVGILFIVTAATVALVQGMRKIPLKYARDASSRNAMIEKTSYLPLKVNHAGVMPIIFASALMMFPPMIINKIGGDFARTVAPYFDFGSTSYLIIQGVMILVFTFFWVATQFNPIQIADDLNRSGAFVPGHRPGEPTSTFLNDTMTRITVAGAIFLVILALLPYVLMNAMGSGSTDFIITQFFGGTSLLIMVGVVLQTMQQIEVQLVQNNYDGFITGGRLRSRKG